MPFFEVSELVWRKFHPGSYGLCVMTATRATAANSLSAPDDKNFFLGPQLSFERKKPVFGI